MNEKPVRVDLSPDVDAWFQGEAAAPKPSEKFKKAKKAVRMMREIGPAYPSFCTHQMDYLKGPGGRTIWNSYVENKTPQAWRMYWVRTDDGAVYIVSLGPHDHTPGEQQP